MPKRGHPENPDSLASFDDRGGIGVVTRSGLDGANGTEWDTMGRESENSVPLGRFIFVLEPVEGPLLNRRHWPEMTGNRRK